MPEIFEFERFNISPLNRQNFIWFNNPYTWKLKLIPQQAQNERQCTNAYGNDLLPFKIMNFYNMKLRLGMEQSHTKKSLYLRKYFAGTPSELCAWSFWTFVFQKSSNFEKKSIFKILQGARKMACNPKVSCAWVSIDKALRAKILARAKHRTPTSKIFSKMPFHWERSILKIHYHIFCLWKVGTLSF